MIKRSDIMEREPLENFLARAHADRVMYMVRLLWKDTPDTFDQNVLLFIERFFQKHPPAAATKPQVSLHEAGHYVISEALGMVAGKAKINGSAFGRSGWGGTAGCIKRPIFERLPWDPADLINEACFGIAGPCSEFILSGGDFCASISEIIETRALATHAAMMLQQDKRQVLHAILVRTATMVNAYQAEIEQVAELLIRRKHINRYERQTGKVLARVLKTSINRLPSANPSHLEELKRLFNSPFERRVAA